MVDVFPPAVRSRIMARNRSHGTKATERRLRALLVRHGIRGWKLGLRSAITGRPDFIFSRARLAVFVDGCFWHGCRRCRTIPVSNRPFWAAKIAGNRKRDRQVTRRLRKEGWKVLRVWEHELRTDQGRVLQEIMRLKRPDTGQARHG